MSVAPCFDPTLHNWLSLLVTAAEIPVYFKWIYYGVNPIAYAQKSMAVNEFGARRWQSIVFPNGQTLGNAILQARCAFVSSSPKTPRPQNAKRASSVFPSVKCAHNALTSGTEKRPDVWVHGATQTKCFPLLR